MYRVKISEQFIATLKNVEEPANSIIRGWINKNVYMTNNPKSLGKPLFKKDNRFWRYRIGDYRLLAIIYEDNKLIVLADIKYNDAIDKKNIKK